MLKIRPRMMHGKWSRKLGTYGPERDIFEKYRVGTVKTHETGLKSISIFGPKREFHLISCAKPLTIISPPEVEGGDARKIQVPLFFVSPMKGSGSIQGATYFALINDELVAYKNAGGNTVTEL